MDEWDQGSFQVSTKLTSNEHSSISWGRSVKKKNKKNLPLSLRWNVKTLLWSVFICNLISVPTIDFLVLNTEIIVTVFHIAEYRTCSRPVLKLQLLHSEIFLPHLKGHLSLICPWSHIGMDVSQNTYSSGQNVKRKRWHSASISVSRQCRSSPLSDPLDDDDDPYCHFLRKAVHLACTIHAGKNVKERWDSDPISVQCNTT